MAKIPCAICGKELGLLSNKTKISGGAVCNRCLEAEGMSVLSNPTTYNEASIKELVKSRELIVHGFRETKSVGFYLVVDEEHRAIRIGKDIFKFENLMSFELLEDGHSITSGGLGSAVAGGLLFGGVGAMVGGSVGSRTTKGVCSSMKIRVSLRNAHTEVVYITFFGVETKKSSPMYKKACDNAQRCISILESIIETMRSEAAVGSGPVIQAASSSADEILKFKALLDQGIITEEEFAAKKKELLNC